MISFTERQETGEAAGDHHGDDDEALGFHAGIGGGGRIGAQHVRSW